ncbi:MAG: hypothetical protein ACYDDA_07605 [Acidiferrobacteraceae bacterium]
MEDTQNLPLGYARRIVVMSKEHQLHVLIALLFMSLPLALAAALRQKPSAVAAHGGHEQRVLA